MQASLTAGMVWVTDHHAMTSMFGKLQSIAGKAGNLAAQLQEKTVTEYLPLIAKLLREKAGPAAIEILNDPARMTELSRTVYQVMPMPVRMAIKEDAFSSAVLAHKDKLIPLIQAQIENEHLDQEKDANAASQESNEAAQAGTESVAVKSSQAEIVVDECQDHYAMSMDNTDGASNTAPQST
ncbi:hypothetical protein KBY97_13825 [Synechococcus sp. ATX 2A4]|uniref:hypothetical protein n=1 Tax=Synechococcus sp. ATX 2A4 TaxID=2823727 RepID=UPI0020CC7B2B|nr:hypothetical protein [Synechococcus sp. ATX 2A4]MCP9886193.1 hypothetical protein [Synechococcus sp. ATX 2A4]